MIYLDFVPPWFHAPGAYLVSFPLCAPLPQSSRGLFGFFTSLCPAPSIDPGLIRLLYLSMPRSPDRLGAYLASFPLCAPLPQSTQGLFGFFTSLRPAPSIDPGLIQLLYLSTPRSLNRPGAYSASLPLYAPLPQSTRGLFGFFTSLCPALPIGSGLIWLLFLSTPRPLGLPGAYSASLSLYAPLPQSARGLFGFFSSLRPALPIFPGLI